jgi:hypothetical protein
MDYPVAYFKVGRRVGRGLYIMIKRMACICLKYSVISMVFHFMVGRRVGSIAHLKA